MNIKCSLLFNVFAVGSGHAGVVNGEALEEVLAQLSAVAPGDLRWYRGGGCGVVVVVVWWWWWWWWWCGSGVVVV